MKKRLLALSLVLVMALSLCVTTAWADEHANHCVCGATHTSVGDHTAAEEVIWTATDTLPATSGSYYLTDDVTIPSNKPWVIGSTSKRGTGSGDNKVDIKLCLNGHTITVDNTGTNPNGYILVENGSLTITDCKGTGKITGDSTSTGTRQIVVTVACWSHGCTLNLFGGTITGITANKGSGVYNEGTFNMYGGTITGNTATGNGGGVFTSTNSGLVTQGKAIPAVFNFYGGTIGGNTGGGDVYINSSSTMNAAGGTVNGTINVAGGTVTGAVQGEVTGNGITMYTVTFNSNGGSAVATQTVFGDDAKATEPADPTREGYTFAGWYAEGKSEPYNFEQALINDNLTLTAKWEEIPAEPEEDAAPSHTPIRRQNTAVTTDTTIVDTTKPDTVTSAKTFDVGTAVYGVLAVASLLGMGYVGKKR